MGKNDLMINHPGITPNVSLGCVCVRGPGRCARGRLSAQNVGLINPKLSKCFNMVFVFCDVM